MLNNHIYTNLHLKKINICIIKTNIYFKYVNWYKYDYSTSSIHK